MSTVGEEVFKALLLLIICQKDVLEAPDKGLRILNTSMQVH